MELCAANRRGHVEVAAGREAAVTEALDVFVEELVLRSPDIFMKADEERLGEMHSSMRSWLHVKQR